MSALGGGDTRDVLAALKAEEDQVIAGIDAVAARLVRLRAALLIGGFDSDQTWEIVRGYFDFLLDHSTDGTVTGEREDDGDE